MEIVALSHLVQIYGTEFIDPRRDSETLESTIKRTVAWYVKALTSDDGNVYKAVAQGFMHVLESCIKPEFGMDISKINELLIRPLVTIFDGGDDKVAQIAASHIYYFLVRGSIDKEYTDLTKFLYSKFLGIFAVSSPTSSYLRVNIWKVKITSTVCHFWFRSETSSRLLHT